MKGRGMEDRMNDRNTEMLFGDDNEVVITITDEDGQSIDVQLLAAFEVEELGQEYIAAVDMEDEEEGEVILLHYNEDVEGNPEISGIEDEDEYEAVAEIFQDLLESGELGDLGLEIEEDEDDGDDEDYLDDIGRLFPGVSIDKD